MLFDFNGFTANIFEFFKTNEFAREILWVILGLILTGSLGYFRKLFTLRKQKQFQQDLHPYYSFADIKKATQHYVPTHFQSNPPSQHGELIMANRVTARERLLPWFLNKALKPDDPQRFYIILAGSGMGKTTFMINLYTRYVHKPLWSAKKRYKIHLLPLGYQGILKRISEIPDHPNTILLLDGLDEDQEATRNYKFRMDRILDKARDFRKVIFTCRTQFFPSEIEEPRETSIEKFGSDHGYQAFAKMYLSPFSDRDIETFLRKKYGGRNSARKRIAKKIVAQSPNLMVRPMILSYIDDLLEEDRSYEYSTNLYAALIDKWIEREAHRVKEPRRDTFRRELYRFSHKVALQINKNRNLKKGLYLPEKDIHRLAKEHKIKIGEMEMKSRSLLNRDLQGNYKFAHKSILEFFLAREAVENPHFAQNFNFEGMDQAELFYEELLLSRRTFPLFRDTKNEGKHADAEGNWKDIQDIRVEDLKYVTELKFSTIKQIEALRPLKMLRSLDVEATKVKNIDVLIALPKLSALNIAQCPVSNLYGLQRAKFLKHLNLAHCPVQDLKYLKDLHELIALDVSHTQVQDLEAIFHMHKLEKLSFDHTEVRALSPLRRMDELKELSFCHTPIGGINPIRDLVQIRKLIMNHTLANNLGPIRDFMQLEHLEISHSHITSLKPLSKLLYLDRLVADECSITDLSPLEKLENLTYLSLNNTWVEDIEPLSGMPNLETLNLAGSKINSLSILPSIPHLANLNISHTSIEDIRPLYDCKELTTLNITESQVSHDQLQTMQEALPNCDIHVIQLAKGEV